MSRWDIHSHTNSIGRAVLSLREYGAHFTISDGGNVDEPKTKPVKRKKTVFIANEWNDSEWEMREVSTREFSQTLLNSPVIKSVGAETHETRAQA